MCLYQRVMFSWQFDSIPRKMLFKLRNFPNADAGELLSSGNLRPEADTQILKKYHLLISNLSSIARKIRVKLKANKNTKLNANYLFLLLIIEV